MTKSWLLAYKTLSSLTLKITNSTYPKMAKDKLLSKLISPFMVPLNVTTTSIAWSVILKDLLLAVSSDNILIKP